MKDQLERLYLAAKELKGLEGVVEIASLLDELPQNINNWATRPIAKSGLVKAQERIGCDVVWLRDGTGDMVKGQPITDYSKIVRLAQCFAELPSELQGDLLRMAETLLADHLSRRSSGAANQSKS